MDDQMLWDFEDQTGGPEGYVAHYVLEHRGKQHQVSIAKMREGSFIVAAHIVDGQWLPYTSVPQGAQGTGFRSLEEVLAEAETQARAWAEGDQSEAT